MVKRLGQKEDARCMLKKDSEKNNNKNDMAFGSRGQGMQGIDKAPGEEPNNDNVQFTQEAFKGKKVDADLSRDEEKPLDNQDI